MSISKIIDLQTALLDLLHAADSSDLRIIVGGGFGIYLKRESIRLTQPQPRTLLSALPEARSTNDLDLFLRPELLIEAERLAPLSRALKALGYEAIPSARNYQFVKGDVQSGIVKIDLLTGPRSRFAGTSAQADTRRVRPKPSVGIHAHPTDEALALEESLLPHLLTGNLSSGESYRAEVYLPHPFTYLMMKLFAFRDRCEDADKDYGRHHALDLYTVLACTTETEWQRCNELARECGQEIAFRDASKVVAGYFADASQLGVLRLRESVYYDDGFEVERFMGALRELFPSP